MWELHRVRDPNVEPPNSTGSIPNYQDSPKRDPEFSEAPICRGNVALLDVWIYDLRMPWEGTTSEAANPLCTWGCLCLC